MSSKRGLAGDDNGLPFTRRRLGDADETPDLLQDSSPDLAMLLDVPAILVGGSFGSSCVEDQLQLEHEALGGVNLDNSLRLEDDESVGAEAQASPPVLPSMPSFGLGLCRQKSFAPSCFLTEVEAEARDGVRDRCAAALSRLVQRNERHQHHTVRRRQAKQSGNV